jgi:hypothetical protein
VPHFILYYAFKLLLLLNSFFSVNFSLLPIGTRETVLKEHIRLSHLHQLHQHRNDRRIQAYCYYCLRWEGSHLLCVNSFKNILGIYHDQWKRLVSNSREGTYRPGPITHGNIGRRSRHNSSSVAACLISICEFLQQLADERGEPYAT